MTRTELIHWLNTELEKRNLSQSEASRRAGLGPNAISEIVNGRTPGLRVCKALARYFGVPAEYVLRLAGHLSPHIDTEDMDPEVRATVEHIVELLEELQDVAPDTLPQIRNLFYMQLQSHLIAVRAGQVAGHSEKEKAQARDAEADVDR